MLLFYIAVSACFVAPTVSLLVGNNTTANIVCYYVPGNIGPEDLDPHLCTHINYAFVRLNKNGNLLIRSQYLDITEGFYMRTVALKQRNPQLKVLLSIGDTNASVFSMVAASSVTRKKLVDSTLNFLETYSFDGIDVDWEKPGRDDAINFVDMLRDLREALDAHGWLLSAAVYPNPSPGYNIVEISKYLHMIHLMCYNFYGPWGTGTGQNSPLFASPLDSPYQRSNLNVAAALAKWLGSGAPRDKVHVGVPFYGRTFALADAAVHGLHAPVHGAGSPPTPPYSLVNPLMIEIILTMCLPKIWDTKQNLELVRKICSQFGNWTTIWDNDQKNHYKYTSTQWLGYDDEKSMGYKTRYVLSQNVAGMMIWQISLDDVKGECGRKQNLLKVINEELLKTKM